MTLKNLKQHKPRYTQIFNNGNLSYNNDFDKRVILKLPDSIKLPDDASIIPEYLGMIFLGFYKVKLKDISKKFINPQKDYDKVRGKDTNIRKPQREIVSKITHCITENPKTWQPKYFEPPCISEYGEILLGRHRLDAYENAGETYIIVAMVRFINFKNKKPLSWLRCAQEKENRKPIIKNEAKDEDTIKNVLLQIQEESIKPIIEDITDCLGYMGINSALKRRKLIKKIFEALKVKSSVEIPYTYTKPRKEQYLKQKYPYKKLSSLSVYDLLKKPQNININDNKDIIFPGSFTDRPDRYPIINSINAYALCSDYPDSQIHFEYSVNTDDIKQVKRVRKLVPKWFKNMEAKILQMADHIRSKNYKKPKVAFLPQLKEDEKN